MRTILQVIAVALVTGTILFADEWPQWRGPSRDGQWRETDVVAAFKEKELKPRWRVPISSGYSGPTVAEGRVYVTDRLTKPEQTERVLCFDWRTGDQLWSYSYPSEYRNVQFPAGPRASVLVHDGRAYSLGSMGHLHAFDASDGKLLWKRNLNSEYSIEMPIWGITASPLIEGDLVIVQAGGSPGACLVAFDRISGEERWRALDDNASYSSPRVIDQAGKRVLLAWTVQHIVGLDPRSGEVYWKHPFGTTSNSGMIVADPARSGRRLFLTAFFDGSMMLDLNPDSLSVSEVWRRSGPSENDTDALHTTMSTPLLIGDYVYGVDSYGELRCLDADTGDRV